MVSVSSYSEVGGHRLNEDVLAIHQHETEPDLWLCFVADGQGGRAGGGPAAQLACDVALEASRRCSPMQLRNARQWSSLLRLADNKVLEDPVAGFTTLVGLGLYRGQIVGVSSGDSAALIVDEHAAVELTASQWKNPPVGSGVAEAVTFTASVHGDWLLLVMTDGV